MTLDPRTPVIVGVGQVDGRTLADPPPAGGENDLVDAPEPAEMMAAAAREAAADAGAGRLLEVLDSVRVVSLLSWRYRDPGRLVADLVGAKPRHTEVSGVGGDRPQQLLAGAARDIAAGRAEAVLITGAESWRTRMRWRRQGERPPWTRQDDDVRPTVAGVDVALASRAESDIGLQAPVQVYPLFEQALRLAAHRSVEAQLDRSSHLWSRFSSVAVDNPQAWSRVYRRPEEIRTPGPRNRWVGWPYPKLMNSNNDVDQGSALLLCSVEVARRLRVPREQWVFPHSSVSAHDTLAVTHRPSLHRSPAIRLAGRRALELAGIGIDDTACVDVYSCFPSAVQVAADELGLPLDDPARPLTVTGGLTFAGGPWNDYVTHAIATTVARLREVELEGFGLVTANGGFLTKHAIGVYGTRPPAGGFRADDVQEAVDAAEPAVVGAEDHAGPATVESWTVMHDRDNVPERAFAALRTPEGARTWGVSVVPDVLATLLEDDPAGGRVRVGGDREFVFTDR